MEYEFLFHEDLAENKGLNDVLYSTFPYSFKSFEWIDYILYDKNLRRAFIKDYEKLKAEFKVYIHPENRYRAYLGLPGFIKAAHTSGDIRAINEINNLIKKYYGLQIALDKIRNQNMLIPTAEIQNKIRIGSSHFKTVPPKN